MAQIRNQKETHVDRNPVHFRISLLCPPAAQFLERRLHLFETLSSEIDLQLQWIYLRSEGQDRQSQERVCDERAAAHL